MNEYMSEVDEELQKLYNERETFILHKEEEAIELCARECELNVLIKRKKQLPINVIAYIFWIIVMIIVCNFVDIAIIFLIPFILKLLYDTIKAIAQLVDNLEVPIIEKLAGKSKKPNINTRINNLTQVIAKKRVIIENYEAQALELKKQINKIIADKGY